MKNITVNARFARAVNVERDGVAAVVGNYILTDNARRLLRRIAEEAAQKPDRAWTLTGPYGAGKSAFSLYLSALLAGVDSPHGKAAWQLCLREDKSLAEMFAWLSAANKGFCPVFITGARESMAPRLLARIADSLDDYFDGKAPPVIAALRNAAKTHAPPSAVAELLHSATVAISQVGGGGLFIVIDEMGKFLEYDADNPNADNAYLLQTLAEITMAGGKKDMPVWLLGVLHQSFGYYTRGFGKSASVEWQKVAGRFSQMTFAETPEQMLHLAARVIQQKFSDAENKTIRRAIAPSAKMLFDCGFLGGRVFAGSVEDIFVPCYPLHPFSAALLALLSEKMGQNERTLFDYLAGGHPCSFMRGVGQLQSVGDFIFPWALYDYFADGGAGFAADSLLAKRRAEIDDALLRLGDNAPLEQKQMLKTIALFNIAGVRDKFAASNAFMAELFGKKTKPALAALCKKSFVNYRGFADEYRVWQGSDFDLDASLQRYENHAPPFCLADELNNNAAAQPLIAHRHAIETGNIRSLPIVFAAGECAKAENAAPRLIVYLAKEGEKLPPVGDNDLLLIGRGSAGLENTLKERRALEQIVDLPELNGDSVAKTEVRERLANTARRAKFAITALVAPAAGRFLYWRGKKLPINSRRELQKIISNALDVIYDEAPHVKNELINRDNPSSQAMAARNKFLAALRRNVGKENIGIEKYPPEKAIYLSLLKKTELHCKIKNVWQLVAPQAQNDKYNFYPLWQKLEAFLESTKTEAQSFDELKDELCAPPFGVKRGLLELFYGLAIFANDGKLAVYEDGVYQPFFDEPQLERFLARPDTFTFKRVCVSGIGVNVLRAYQKILGGGKSKGGEMLAITKPLVQRIGALPEYAKNTERLSEAARGLCRAVVCARSPFEMLLEDIPAALGFAQRQMTTEDERAKFAAALSAAMAELDGALPKMKSRFCELLAQGLDLPKNAPLAEVRKVLSGRVVGLERYTLDRDGVGGFLSRAALADGDNDRWLERMLLFLSGKNPGKWSDTDIDIAESKLAEYVRRMKSLETRCAAAGNGNGNGLVFVHISGADVEYESAVRPLANGASEKSHQVVRAEMKKMQPAERVSFAVAVLQSAINEQDNK